MRNHIATKLKRKILAVKFLHYHNQGKQFIFLDETHLSDKYLPPYSYGKLGEKVTFEFSKKIQSLHLLAAISENKLLGFRIFSEPITTKNYGGFIIDLLNNNKEIKNNLHNYAFFMDKSKIHTAQILKPFYRCLNVIYNAPYSPSLNPIEEVFGI